MYYVYTYFVNEIPRYVGHGTGGRFSDHFIKLYGGCPFHRWLKAERVKPVDIRIIVEPIGSKTQAKREEAIRIDQYGCMKFGTGTLINWVRPKIVPEPR